MLRQQTTNNWHRTPNDEQQTTYNRRGTTDMEHMITNEKGQIDKTGHCISFFRTRSLAFGWAFKAKIRIHSIKVRNKCCVNKFVGIWWVIDFYQIKEVNANKFFMFYFNDFERTTSLSSHWSSDVCNIMLRIASNQTIFRLSKILTAQSQILIVAKF